MTERLADPDVINDPKLLMRVMSERSKSEEIVQAFESYRGAEGDYDTAVEMMRESGDDPEMKEMAREESKMAEQTMSALEETIKVLLLPSDPNDSRNVMLEIR
ncbi:hypothetical protein TrRE_jg2735, partial [Triparma retinervis]